MKGACWARQQQMVEWANYQWPWHSQVKAEAQELTWKMPGVCSSEVNLPVCQGGL